MNGTSWNSPSDFPYRAAPVYCAAWNGTKHAMRKVLRGCAKDKGGNLFLIGTMPAPHSKDKSSLRERWDKRHSVPETHHPAFRMAKEMKARLNGTHGSALRAAFHNLPD